MKHIAKTVGRLEILFIFEGLNHSITFTKPIFMKKTFTLLLLVVLTTLAGLQWVISSDEKSERERRSMVDTRIDNNGYYKRLAEQGLYTLNPEVRVAPAVYTGSKIKAFSVVTEDSPDIAVTEINSTQSENSIFVSPLDNMVVLNSNNSTQNPVGSLYGANDFYTFDGTETWEGEVQGAGGGNSGDPGTAIGRNGRWYVNYIANSYGQGVSYSDDEGENWTVKTISPNPGDLADKNHFWIDNSLASPYEGNLYCAWTDFGGSYDSEIVVSSSSDDGVTWSTRVPISTAVNAGSHNQGVNISTGPNGEVYAVWAIYNSWPSDEGAIGFSRSLDGGATWEPAVRIISNIRGIRTSETSKNHRVNSFPVMATDISGGTYNGNLYVTWSNMGTPGVNNAADGIDVYMIKSSDNGTTWSTPTRINQNPYGEGKEHYFGWITSDGSTGTLSAIFYGDRNVNSNQCEVFCANSYDAGETWEDFKVSDVAFTPSPISGLAGGYMGDYLGITARDGRVYPVWPDNRSGHIMSYTSVYETSTLSKPFGLTAEVAFETGISTLNWQYETGPGFLYFLIYRDGVLLTNTANTSYNDQLPTYGVYDYAVTAFYEGDDESGSANASVQWGDAQITVDPMSVTQTMRPEETADRQIVVTNSGQLPLNYSISSEFIETNREVNEYCAASGGGDEYISNVSMGDINQSSGSDMYSDYTNLSTEVKDDAAVLLTITNGNPYSSDQCGVWVDWDQNGVFDDEAVVVEGNPGNGPYTANIQAPVGALSGTTTMRIRVTYTGSVDPCGTTQYGEVEDYTLNVVSWLSYAPKVGVVAPGSTETITLTFKTYSIPLGDYYANLNITNNDPDTEVVTVPIHLIVSEIEFIVSAGTPEFCEGGSTQLFAQATGGTEGFTYYWETADGELVSNEQNPVVSPTVTTTYIAYAVQGLETFTSQPVTVTVHPLPIVELGENQTLCGEETLVLDAGNEGSTFLWSNGATTQTITVGATEFGVGTHEISVQVTSPFSCQTSDAVSVTIEAIPVVALGDDQQHCGTDAVVLDAGNAGSTFLWSNGETSQTISVNPEAVGYGTHEFSVTVTSPLGCQSNDAVQLTFYQAPPVVDLGQDTTRCLVDQITLSAGQTGYSYLWSTGETTESITLVGNTVGVGAKTYYVDLTNENNCVSRSTEKVVEFLDCSGLNENYAAQIDVYPVPSTGVITLKFNQLSNETFRIRILNAAGNIVYSQNDVQTSVNKLTLNLTTQPAGMYTLVLEGKTTIQKKIIINR